MSLILAEVFGIHDFASQTHLEFKNSKPQTLPHEFFSYCFRGAVSHYYYPEDTERNEKTEKNKHHAGKDMEDYFQATEDRLKEVLQQKIPKSKKFIDGHEKEFGMMGSTPSLNPTLKNKDPEDEIVTIHSQQQNWSLLEIALLHANVLALRNTNNLQSNFAKGKGKKQSKTKQQNIKDLAKWIQAELSFVYPGFNNRTIELYGKLVHPMEKVLEAHMSNTSGGFNPTEEVPNNYDENVLDINDQRYTHKLVFNDTTDWDACNIFVVPYKLRLKKQSDNGVTGTPLTNPINMVYYHIDREQDSTNKDSILGNYEATHIQVEDAIALFNAFSVSTDLVYVIQTSSNHGLFPSNEIFHVWLKDRRSSWKISNDRNFQ